MQHSTSSQNIIGKPSFLVCIAYQQLSMMTGIKDPTESSTVEKSQAISTVKETQISCVRRLFQLPIFVSISSSFSNAYTTVKDSHESVASILNSAERQINVGCNYVRPYTTKVTASLETPLKGIDHMICVSLDFLEEKVPSIKLPPRQMFENMMESYRWTVQSFISIAMDWMQDDGSPEDVPLKKITSQNHNNAKKDS